MTCSFDFDGTLTERDAYNYARHLKRNGARVLIITQRPPAMHKDVFIIAKRLGFDLCDIIFCGNRKKEEVLSELEYTFHLDNKQIDAKNCVLYEKGFREKCEKLINDVD